MTGKEKFDAMGPMELMYRIASTKATGVGHHARLLLALRDGDQDMVNRLYREFRDALIKDLDAEDAAIRTAALAATEGPMQ